MDADELEQRLQEALQESEEQHRSLAEENATLQQRVRQVSRLCRATPAQGSARLPQTTPGGSDTALAGTELVEAVWVGWAALSCSRAHAGSGLLHTPA